MLALLLPLAMVGVAIALVAALLASNFDVVLLPFAVIELALTATNLWNARARHRD